MIKIRADIIKNRIWRRVGIPKTRMSVEVISASDGCRAIIVNADYQFARKPIAPLLHALSEIMDGAPAYVNLFFFSTEAVIYYFGDNNR